jgi:hypothetical protein
MCRGPISAHIVQNGLHQVCQVDTYRMKSMSLEQLSSLAQVFGSIGVIVSLIFVGLQIKQNTGALQRNEHNSTMEQWTVIRMAIAKNRDIAELMTAGLHGESATDAADQLRLEQMLAEYAWAAFHIWDRTQRGIFPQGTFELTGGAALAGVLRTARGGAWWRGAKHVGFVPGFVSDVDAVIAKDSGASSVVAGLGE